MICPKKIRNLRFPPIFRIRYGKNIVGQNIKHSRKKRDFILFPISKILCFVFIPISVNLYLQNPFFRIIIFLSSLINMSKSKACFLIGKRIGVVLLYLRKISISKYIPVRFKIRKIFSTFKF